MQLDRRYKKLPTIYFIVPAPLDISPGQRFRFEQYLTRLSNEGYRFKISFFYNSDGWHSLYLPGRILKKTLNVVRGFLKRLIDLFKVNRYDYIYLYREAAPVGPPVFEWCFVKLLKKKIIYDFDDAIWVPIVSEHNKIVMRMKWFRKVSNICRWSHKVSVGNAFLASFASKYNSSVVIVPTVVDTENRHNCLQNHSVENLTVGWTGTFSTLKYLEIVMPAIIRLQEKYDFVFTVIANKDPELPLRKYKFINWSKETEMQDLLSIHIGLMPLYDSEIERGKCGFKAIQYMSLGIPAIVSPVGVNSFIVSEGENGYIASSDIEWEEKIEKLLTNSELRKKMGLAARLKIENEYSVKKTFPVFRQLFE